MFDFVSKMFKRIFPNADKRQQYKAEQAAENRDMSKSDTRAASWLGVTESAGFAFGAWRIS